MKNITLAIDDALLANARGYAKSNGTTLNALVRRELTRLLEADARQADARNRLIALAQSSTADMGKDFRFNREEMYEAGLSGHQHSPLRGRRKAAGT